MLRVGARRELVSMGLGSCVGVALVDREQAVAGLAHVMLPAANAAYSAPAKFADRAVPALVALVERCGAHSGRLEAILAGGAQMFGKDGLAGLDLGARRRSPEQQVLFSRDFPS